MKRYICLLVTLAMTFSALAVGEGSLSDREQFQSVGNIVRFGRYEQDNKKKNGPEDIEWIVLKTEKGKSLLLSRYLLDAKPYNNTMTEVTWEKCSLRKWLNKDFLGTAFTKSEQSAILTTAVDNSRDQAYKDYEKDGGKNTQDKIFLLSCREAFSMYFKNATDRKGAATDYAIAQGAFTSDYRKDGKLTGWWWLRSPGRDHKMAAGVFNDGESCSNMMVFAEDICIRPALWIDLDSDIF